MAGTLTLFSNIVCGKAKIMTEKYQQDLADLLSGKVSELVIAPEEFNDFRRAWEQLPQRKEIIGNAQRNGTVIYHYVESV